ncbi:hypothetical protein [Nocardiopsis kunsanensis]|uniref:hypothetical protein n=1 Tax=Nocardiopsis kunsanensis TaxID=141693 RepID=UPI001360B634|nr:hypothetical protein [Nocardiopsis kunsanensis]
MDPVHVAGGEVERAVGAVVDLHLALALQGPGGFLVGQGEVAQDRQDRGRDQGQGVRELVAVGDAVLEQVADLGGAGPSRSSV